jgi:diguanylate cyclase (GGDEF)-like protein/PAS domain S-box-containing protein
MDGHCVESLSSELLEEIVSLSSQSLLVVDASGPDIGIVYANPAYEEISGYSLADLRGGAWLAHAAAEEDSPELVQLRRSLVCDDPVEINLPFLRRDGEIWLGRLRLMPLKSSGQEQRLWLVQCHANERAGNASAELLKRALGQARRKLASLDRTDQVTGLMSRSQFELILRRELAGARRDHRLLSLMLFTVPELDIYRQTFGDNAADSCLRMIGAQIAGTFRRASDLCARFDPATLAVAMVGQGEEEVNQLITLVENKARNLGLHNPRGRLGRYVIVRGVWVEVDPDGDDLEGLMARCEAACKASVQPEPHKVSGTA